MRVFVFEWTSSAGGPDPLLAEGWALLESIIEDLSRVPAVSDVATALDRRFEAAARLLPPGVRVEWTSAQRKHAAAVPARFDALVRAADRTLVIAPESDGLHERLARRVEALGGELLGSPASAVAIAADKLELARRLRGLGVPAPPLRALDLEPDAPPAGPALACPADASAFPAVLKPQRGAGAAWTYLVRSRRELASTIARARAAGAPRRMTIGPYLPGVAASACFLVAPDSGGACLPLAPGYQHVILGEDGVASGYTGGRTPLASDGLAERATSLARAALAAVPGLRGFVGVDLVLGVDGEERDAVIELNPRLTTSYLLLRRIYPGVNLAARWLELAGAGGAQPSARREPARLPPPATPCRVWVCGAGRAPAVAALDVGGANLKAAHAAGPARSMRFALWRRPAELAARLGTLVGTLPPFDLLALTTTAELCDCFATKREGVLHVLEATAAALRATRPRARLEVWRNDGRLCSLEEARAEPRAVAAANWLALATLAARVAAPRAGLLVDLGSTTADLIAFRDGAPLLRGRTDTERLRTRELVYTGVRRTPLHALLGVLPYRGMEIPAIPELFATAADVHLLLATLPEDPGDRDTADGGPATREGARVRLARCVGLDGDEFTAADAEALARAVGAAQAGRLVEAGREVLGSHALSPEVLVVSGEGERFLRPLLARAWPGCEVVSFADRYGVARSEAACALALCEIAGDAIVLLPPPRCGAAPAGLSGADWRAL